MAFLLLTTSGVLPELLGALTLLSPNTYSGSQLPPPVVVNLWFKDIYLGRLL